MWGEERKLPMLDIPSNKKAILMKPGKEAPTDYKIHAVINIKSMDQTLRYDDCFYEYAGVMDGYAIYNYVSTVI
jgi:hypothetical protein